MDDLIKRQASVLTLLEKGQKSRRYKVGEIWELNFDEIREALETVPSVDAVEVVRCRDCKWCREQYDTDGNVPYWICMNWDGGTDADGFCHEAERKTDV